MKYSDLIQFKPIESVVKLLDANDATRASEFVSSYVMSDSIAHSISHTMLSQLKLDDAIDKHGILLIGNYGTGKSHLVSLLSAVAQDASNLQNLQNASFADSAVSIAGRFEVLRIEMGSVTTRLRTIVLSEIAKDFAARGISYSYPEEDAATNNKETLLQAMALFGAKYPGKGYLIIVDEFLDFLGGQNETAIRRDLNFMRELGEIVGNSRLRVIFVMQEKLFENPTFSFVTDHINRVRDRFDQLIISKEDTSYVVAERILKKTEDQKAWIREHLQDFCSLYANMQERLEEFVELYPIHPAFIEVFNKIIHIENRHVLRNISDLIGTLMDQTVPEGAPGIYSFDSYWDDIYSNLALHSNPNIKEVVEKSELLLEIVGRSFTREVYKPVALKIIHALSVFRLSTIDIFIHSGLTSANLRDELCLFIADLPDKSSDTLQALVQTVLNEIMTTVSGQFIDYNRENGQYYLDLKKDIDYDENIRLRASLLADSNLDRYYFDILYYCLNWETKEYVSGFRIYDHNMSWQSHNIYRKGYLFLGTPEDRPTAQPPRDYYIYFLPPFSDLKHDHEACDDEVFFTFKPNAEFTEQLRLYAAARLQAEQADTDNRVVYTRKAEVYRKFLATYLTEHRFLSFEVTNRGIKQQPMAVLQSAYRQNDTLKEMIDQVAALSLEPWFTTKYPLFPKFKVMLSLDNEPDTIQRAFNRFAGPGQLQSNTVLESFGLLDGDTISLKSSQYAAHFQALMQQLPAGKVLNFNDLYYEENTVFLDKQFKISYLLLPVVLLALVYNGDAEITLKNGTLLTASNLDQVPKLNRLEIQEFRTLSKPKELHMEVLERLYEILGIPLGQIKNPAQREAGLEALLAKAKAQSESAAKASAKLNGNLTLWGEEMISQTQLPLLKASQKRLNDFFANFASRFNMVAKLRNFTQTLEMVEQAGQDIANNRMIFQLERFRSEVLSLVTYCNQMASMELPSDLKEKLATAKSGFFALRDEVLAGADGQTQAELAVELLSAVRKEYIEYYLDEHRKYRLSKKESDLKGQIMSSTLLSNLEHLAVIELIPDSKLKELKEVLASLKVCYEATSAKLNDSPYCPYCNFRLGSDQHHPVKGILSKIEERLEALLQAWTGILLKTLADQTARDQDQFLKEDQREVIERFLSTRALPETVDTFFVDAVTALHQGFQPVTIPGDDLLEKLAALGPVDLPTLQHHLDKLITDYARGKDKDKLRLIIAK